MPTNEETLQRLCPSRFFRTQKIRQSLRPREKPPRTDATIGIGGIRSTYGSISPALPKQCSSDEPASAYSIVKELRRPGQRLDRHPKRQVARSPGSITPRGGPSTGLQLFFHFGQKKPSLGKPRGDHRSRALTVRSPVTDAATDAAVVHRGKWPIPATTQTTRYAAARARNQL